MPRLPPIVPRLRICGEPTVRDASARAGSGLGDVAPHRLGVGQPRAEDERAVRPGEPSQLLDLVQVDQRGRTRAVEVELDEHVCAALHEPRVAELRLQAQRLVERSWRVDVHRYRSSRT